MKTNNSARKIAQLLFRDGPWCWYCGVLFEEVINPPTVEHLGPERRTPGPDRIECLVAACYLCNHIKGILSDKIRYHERIDPRWARERRGPTD